MREIFFSSIDHMWSSLLFVFFFLVWVLYEIFCKAYNPLINFHPLNQMIIHLMHLWQPCLKSQIPTFDHGSSESFCGFFDITSIWLSWWCTSKRYVWWQGKSTSPICLSNRWTKTDTVTWRNLSSTTVSKETRRT